ncbi:MAG: hypothetical protein E6H09_23755 [Bacteroidetes bacterium]|nr:MAG: hypothetical protein E6H09_23755 [Bacteroidota bacterium]
MPARKKLWDISLEVMNMTGMDTYDLWALICNQISDMAKSVNGGNKGVINPVYAVTPKGWKVILLKF